MSFTYIRCHAALKAQSIDRKAFMLAGSLAQATRPSSGRSSCLSSHPHPRTPDASPTHRSLLRRVQGDAVFLKGTWSAATFIFNYGIIGLALVISIGWKADNRAPFRRSGEVYLTSDLELFDTLTEHYRREREAAPYSMKDKILANVF